jgi:hypothetical protein
MKTSPGAMVFNRGTMMTNVPLISNLLAIGKRPKTATSSIDANTRRVNARRINHNHNIGDRVKF